jgi:hypothetical protein
VCAELGAVVCQQREGIQGPTRWYVVGRGGDVEWGCLNCRGVKDGVKLAAESGVLGLEGGGWVHGMKDGSAWVAA